MNDIWDTEYTLANIPKRPRDEHCRAVGTAIKTHVTSKALTTDELMKRKLLIEFLNDKIQDSKLGYRVIVSSRSHFMLGLKDSDIHGYIVRRPGVTTMYQTKEGLLEFFARDHNFEVCSTHGSQLRVKSNWEEGSKAELVLVWGETEQEIRYRLYTHYVNKSPLVLPLTLAFDMWMKEQRLNVEIAYPLQEIAAIMTIFYLSEVKVDLMTRRELDSARARQDWILDKNGPDEALALSLGSHWIQFLRFYAVEFNPHNTDVVISKTEGSRKRGLLIRDPLRPDVAIIPHHDTPAFQNIILCMKQAYLYFAIPRSVPGSLYHRILFADKSSLCRSVVFHKVVCATGKVNSKPLEPLTYAEWDPLVIADAVKGENWRQTEEIKGLELEAVRVRMFEKTVRGGVTLRYVLFVDVDALSEILPQSFYKYEFRYRPDERLWLAMESLRRPPPSITRQSAPTGLPRVRVVQSMPIFPAPLMPYHYCSYPVSTVNYYYYSFLNNFIYNNYYSYRANTISNHWYSYPMSTADNDYYSNPSNTISKAVQPDLKLLDSAIRQHYDFNGMKVGDYAIREEVLTDLYETLQPFLLSKLKTFGSCCNGFGRKSSGLDVYAETKRQGQGVNVAVYFAIEKKLQKARHMFQRVEFVPSGVPVVKFFHVGRGIEGDISCNNELALRNTELLRMYAEIDPRVKILGVFLKTVTKITGINDSTTGYLSSYAIIIMLIHYLQRTTPPVLPVLQELSQIKSVLIEGHNVAFFSDLPSLQSVWPFRYANQESVGQLWLGFLHYYLDVFDQKRHVISIRTLTPVLRAGKLFFRQSDESLFAIEDPFITDKNLARCIDSSKNDYILEVFTQLRKMCFEDCYHRLLTKHEFHIPSQPRTARNQKIEAKKKITLKEALRERLMEEAAKKSVASVQ